MSKPEFVYTTYIETSAEKLWHALTDGDFTERYWFGHRAISDWKVGSAFSLANQAGPKVIGKILESDPLRRLTYSWDPQKEDSRHERTSRVTFDLEPRGTVVKLTVTHDNLDEGGKTLRDISGGWPLVIASLKSLLETGRPLPSTALTPSSQKEQANV
ncbi:SRPBCC family protein [Bradyrhizobium sp.]|jgi:uncharacterized protein YndB with AHSA1/START domain|uniref:SRPBCC family protein n=1 Tax=Bradyrhizobium sp. TaxID=376 RepID=UPI003C420075